MPVLKKLKKMLDDSKISYELYNHPTAFTAQEIAAAQHIPGKEMAKVVMLDVDGSMIMAVIPASRKISFEKVRTALGAKQVDLAPEDKFAEKFPNCEIGAMPPFGNLFGLPVFVDPILEEDESIYFNAGNHQQTVRLAYKSFKALAKPRVVSLTTEPKRKAA